MPKAKPGMSDEEFKLLTLRNAYGALAGNPARFNLVPARLERGPNGEPRIHCPSCDEFFDANIPSLIQTCSNCEAAVLIVEDSKNDETAAASKKGG